MSANNGTQLAHYPYKKVVWLIRHGQSTSNCGVWSASPNEVGLTEQGKTESLALAEQIITRPDLIIASPMQRALQTAEPTRLKWPDVPVEIWPIQEFTYLSPTKYQNMTAEERKKIIQNYWQQANPFYSDGEDSETFANFIQRVQTFQQTLLTKKGFILVFGHGQFFKAFLLGNKQSFATTPLWMKEFRHDEISEPMLNGEIIELSIQ